MADRGRWSFNGVYGVHAVEPLKFETRNCLESGRDEPRELYNYIPREGSPFTSPQFNKYLGKNGKEINYKYNRWNTIIYLHCLIINGIKFSTLDMVF